MNGDWNCHACGDHVFARKVKCGRCGAQRRDKSAASAAPPSMRKGDWLCPTCNDVQFASRLQCRKCNAAKPAAANAADAELCMVCLEKTRNTSLVHGVDAHMVCCNECAAKVTTCPVCRKDVERRVTTYVS